MWIHELAKLTAEHLQDVAARDQRAVNDLASGITSPHPAGTCRLTGTVAEDDCGYIMKTHSKTYRETNSSTIEQQHGDSWQDLLAASSENEATEANEANAARRHQTHTTRRSRRSAEEARDATNKQDKAHAAWQEAEKKAEAATAAFVDNVEKKASNDAQVSLMEEYARIEERSGQKRAGSSQRLLSSRRRSGAKTGLRAGTALGLGQRARWGSVGKWAKKAAGSVGKAVKDAANAAAALAKKVAAAAAAAAKAAYEFARKAIAALWAAIVKVFKSIANGKVLRFDLYMHTKLNAILMALYMCSRVYPPHYPPHYPPYYALCHTRHVPSIETRCCTPTAVHTYFPEHTHTCLTRVFASRRTAHTYTHTRTRTHNVLLTFHPRNTQRSSRFSKLSATR